MPSCQFLVAASKCPGGAALAPLLQLLQPQVHTTQQAPRFHSRAPTRFTHHSCAHAAAPVHVPPIWQVVLQKSMLLTDNAPCNEIYILLKGELQAELSLAKRQEYEKQHGAAPVRRGGAALKNLGLLGTAQAGINEADAAKSLAESVLKSLAEDDSYRKPACLGLPGVPTSSPPSPPTPPPQSYEPPFNGSARAASSTPSPEPPAAPTASVQPVMPSAPPHSVELPLAAHRKSCSTAAKMLSTVDEVSPTAPAAASVSSPFASPFTSPSDSPLTSASARAPTSAAASTSLHGTAGKDSTACCCHAAAAATAAPIDPPPPSPIHGAPAFGGRCAVMHASAEVPAATAPYAYVVGGAALPSPPPSPPLGDIPERSTQERGPSRWVSMRSDVVKNRITGGRETGGVRNTFKKSKGHMQTRRILDRPGSVVGLADPLNKPEVSPFIVTATKVCDVMQIKGGALKQVLLLMPFEDSNIICAAVQKEYNATIDYLKAKDLRSTTVDDRASQHSKMEGACRQTDLTLSSYPPTPTSSPAQALTRLHPSSPDDTEREQRAAEGFHSSENVKDVLQRISVLEEAVVKACNEARELREKVRPIMQVASLVQQWADVKRQEREDRLDGANLFTGHVGRKRTSTAGVPRKSTFAVELPSAEPADSSAAADGSFAGERKSAQRVALEERMERRMSSFQQARADADSSQSFGRKSAFFQHERRGSALFVSERRGSVRALGAEDAEDHNISHMMSFS